VFSLKHNEVLDKKVAIIQVQGPLNSTTGPDFEEYINKLMDENIRFILFDAERLEFISSAGIGLFIFIHKKLSELSGSFLMFNLPDEIKSLFNILGFDKMFTIAGSRIDAMQIIDKQIELKRSNNSKKNNGSKKPDKSINTVNETAIVQEEKNKENENGFDPFVIECTKCTSLIRIKGSGDYMCPECNSEFSIMKDHSVVS